MDIFEKHTFPQSKVDRRSYYTPLNEDEDIDEDFMFDDLDDIEPIDELDSDALDDEILAEEEAKASAAAERQEYNIEPLSPAIEEGTELLLVKNLCKEYKQGQNKLQILNNVDLRIYAGEIAALVGPSGSGKSTLLHILGLLDSPTSGQVVMEGRDISRQSDRARTKLRNEHIGFIYQFHHLLPEFTALENVALPHVIAGISPKQAQDKAAVLLEQLGLGHRLTHRPATLSGGEQQRVAIARSLMNDPHLLFADEPTGNLDPETSAEVFELLLDVVRSRGIGALIATHNLDLANQMDRILEVKSGRILPY